MPLVTLDEFKLQIDAKDDADDLRLTAILNRATAFIEKFCRRTFASATYTSELYDGSGTDTLVLRNFPIVSGTTPTVVEGGTALSVGTNLATADYDVLVYHSEGELIKPYGLTFYPFRNWYAVTYQAGYAAVPQDIQQACVDLGMIMANEKDRSGLASKTAGQQSTTYTRLLPESSRQALELHRDMILGRVA